MDFFCAILPTPPGAFLQAGRCDRLWLNNLSIFLACIPGIEDAISIIVRRWRPAQEADFQCPPERAILEARAEALEG